MDTCLLTLVVTPDIADAVADWLLARVPERTFLSTPAHCHGMAPAAMSHREQVTGRQARVLFQMEVERDAAVALCRGLAGAFPAAGIHYRLGPLEETGAL